MLDTRRITRSFNNLTNWIDHQLRAPLSSLSTSGALSSNMHKKDSDGEAGIALVGVHSEYPGKFQSEEKYSEKEGPATVGLSHRLGRRKILFEKRKKIHDKYIHTRRWMY